MSNNNLELYSLHQLHDNEVLTKSNTNGKLVRYFIDSYQRGYRWDQKQINLLMDDLWEFHQKFKNKALKINEYYCLQPIVVKPRTNENNIHHWEVLDGQQRLTSLKILIKYLLDKTSLELEDEYAITVFEIAYKTRSFSKSFLDNINIEYSANNKSDNIDFYYMSSAYKAINDWFDNKGIIQKKEKRAFLDQLLASEDRDNPIKVIWYEVNDDTDSYEIFTRLNIGKIKLTNSELVKALFLKKTENDELDSRLILNEIASDWNSLENRLQNDEFWYFIFNPNSNIIYPNRLEFIFDLYCNRTGESEEYHTFFYISNLFSSEDNSKQRLEVWRKFKSYFLNIEGWFINLEFYHFIGFLIAIGYPILDIITLNKEKNKNEFFHELHKKIKDIINCNEDELRDLKYKNKLIFPILLLFNVITIQSTKKSNYRFPFNLLKSQNWDIEHIRSKNDKILSKDEEWKSWIRDIVEYFTNKDIDDIFNDGLNESEISNKFELSVLGKDLEKELSNLISCYELNNFQKSILQLSFNYFRSYFQEDTDSLDKDSLGNLSLLDASTNRSYGNSFYTIKRKRIQENGKYGLFTPICTTNTFMKVYSKKLENLNYWTVEDAESYLQEIINVLNPFLKPNSDE